MSDRLYCSLAEVVADLDNKGVRSTSVLMDRIRQASDWIDRNLGWFIPTTETRRFDGMGGIDLYVGDLLSSSPTIVDDEDTLQASDYLLYPRQRLWPNGPYTRITIDPDATTLGAWSWEEDIIAVTGKWGLYEESKSTGATVASQDDSSTSLVVEDASGVSPGQVLLIETEQELVEEYGSPTDSTANTAEAVDASEEEIDLDNASLVNIGEIIRIDFEQMKILDIASNTILVERGWNRTKITTHNTAVAVYVYRTFTVKRGANGTTAAAHTSKAISRYIPPYIVNYLCRQMTVLMEKKAQSQYAGKVGNVELGEVFYMQEFPSEVIDTIRQNYLVPVL